jgi:hypothetical protein
MVFVVQPGSKAEHAIKILETARDFQAKGKTATAGCHFRDAQSHFLEAASSASSSQERDELIKLARVARQGQRA